MLIANLSHSTISTNSMFAQQPNCHLEEMQKTLCKLGGGFLKPIKPYSALLFMCIILCTAQKRYLCTLVCRFCISRKGGTGGAEWGHPQGDMHVVAAGLGCKRTMVATRLANFHLGCMKELRKCYSPLVGVS